MRVVTANARKELSPALVEALVRQVGRLGADVILWQEVETRDHRRAIEALPGYATFWPGGPADAIPISYRLATFTTARFGQVRRAHAGEAKVTPARYVASIILTDLDGVVWPVVNTHMISAAWTRHPERRKRWNRHARILARRCRYLARRWGRVVGGGDVNRDHWTPAGTVGIWPQRPTHGSRRYDLLFVRGRIALNATAWSVDTASDHHAVVVDLEAVL